MRLLRDVAICCSILSVVACVSPRLGFPTEKVELPIEVTLVSTFAHEGVVDMQMGTLQNEAWKFIYFGKYTEMLNKIDSKYYGWKLQSVFLENAQNVNEFLTLNPDQMLDVTLTWNRDEKGPKEYSGYDFSEVKDRIPSRYILALTVTKWGYLVNTNKEQSGPFMTFLLQLIDRESNNCLWEYEKTVFLPILSILRDTDWGSITQADIEEVYLKIIPRTVDKIFKELNTP